MYPFVLLRGWRKLDELMLVKPEGAFHLAVTVSGIVMLRRAITVLVISSQTTCVQITLLKEKKKGLLPRVTVCACDPSAGEAEEAEEGGHKFETIKDNVVS